MCRGSPRDMFAEIFAEIIAGIYTEIFIGIFAEIFTEIFARLFAETLVGIRTFLLSVNALFKSLWTDLTCAFVDISSNSALLGGGVEVGVST